MDSHVSRDGEEQDCDQRMESKRAPCATMVCRMARARLGFRIWRVRRAARKGSNWARKRWFTARRERS